MRELHRTFDYTDYCYRSSNHTIIVYNIVQSGQVYSVQNTFIFYHKYNNHDKIIKFQSKLLKPSIMTILSWSDPRPPCMQVLAPCCSNVPHYHALYFTYSGHVFTWHAKHAPSRREETTIVNIWPSIISTCSSIMWTFLMLSI